MTQERPNFIVLHLGGLRLSMDASFIYRRFMAAVPPALIDPSKALAPQDKALRFALKGFLRMALPWLDAKVKSALPKGAAYPPVLPPPGADIVEHSLQWLVGAGLRALTEGAWEADYQETDDGEILVTDVRAAHADEPPGVDARSASLVDGSDARLPAAL